MKKAKTLTIAETIATHDLQAFRAELREIMEMHKAKIMPRKGWREWGESAKVGDDCPICAASNHTGIWNGRRWIVCPTCNDNGVLDDKGIAILTKTLTKTLTTARTQTTKTPAPQRPNNVGQQARWPFAPVLADSADLTGIETTSDYETYV